MNVFRFRNKKGQPLKPAKAERGNGGVSVVTLTKEFIAGDILLKEAIQKQFLFLLLLSTNRIFFMWLKTKWLL